MTLKELAEYPKLEISPLTACRVIGGDPYLLYLQGRDRPEMVPFKFRFAGKNMRINKASLLDYYSYQPEETA